MSSKKKSKQQYEIKSSAESSFETLSAEEVSKSDPDNSDHETGYEVQMYVNVPIEIFGSEDQFMMPLAGHGFEKVGLSDGDYVLFRRTSEALPGDLIATLLDGQAALRRYFPEDGHVRLTTEDERPDVIVDSCEIRGVAKMAIKKITNPMLQSSSL